MSDFFISCVICVYIHNTRCLATLFLNVPTLGKWSRFTLIITDHLSPALITDYVSILDGHKLEIAKQHSSYHSIPHYNIIYVNNIIIKPLHAQYLIFIYQHLPYKSREYISACLVVFIQHNYWDIKDYSRG